MIHIADVSLINYVNQGTTYFNEYVLIVRTDVNGTRLWNQAEYVKVLAVDANAGTLSVQRNAIPWATLPLAIWPADGHTQIAAAITEFIDPSQMGKFSINYSTNCPVDAQGRTATDVMLAYLASEFSSTGRSTASRSTTHLRSQS